MGQEGLGLRVVQQRLLQHRKVAARIFAFICHKTSIPAARSRNPLHDPGIVRHVELGRAGGGHTDPTQDDRVWRRFVAQVQEELERGDFRESWGRGTLQRID